MANEELIAEAMKITREYVNPQNVSVGHVGCALVSEGGKLHLGVSVHVNCDVGFCAEYGAVSSMLVAGEYKIEKIVSVHIGGTIFPPCGRCREFIYQIDASNLDTEVIVENDKTMLLRELLPEMWQMRPLK
ncbi:MAG: cytidine deaminase [Candidatus Vogelbacteria bacterium]|nr:cytidine deaminase [Candidatus Vogelbacteria bacterium]